MNESSSRALTESIVTQRLYRFRDLKSNRVCSILRECNLPAPLWNPDKAGLPYFVILSYLISSEEEVEFPWLGVHGQPADEEGANLQ